MQAFKVHSLAYVSRFSLSLASGAALAMALSGCAAGVGERDRDDSPGNGSPTAPGGYPAPGGPTVMTPQGNSQPTAPQTPLPGSPQNPEVPVQDPNLPVDGTGDDVLVGDLGTAQMGGSGQSGERYAKASVTRNGQNYFLMANGWGPGFDSHTISWNGTSFTVVEMEGTQGPQYQPASFPTVFCGVYSDSRSGECGLPATIESLTSLRTAWAWAPNGNDGQYNASYDIWLGTGPGIETHSGYLMVWYREPPGQQPAGSPQQRGVTVAEVEGTWDIWTGQVGGRPIINWVRTEGQDTYAMEFDILDFVRDAEMRGLTVPGTHILSVATGFEIWNGPVNNLESIDFYVDVQ